MNYDNTFYYSGTVLMFNIEVQQSSKNQKQTNKQKRKYRRATHIPL